MLTEEIETSLVSNSRVARQRSGRRRDLPQPLHAVPPRKAVFIDKDGTLLQNVPYNVDPARIEFTPHALEGLKLLQAFDFALVVVTNQPGVALGYFDQAALSHLEQALTQRLADEGVQLSGFYACPHAPGPAGAPICLCRKPAPGLILRAAQALRIDPNASWMVGDILDDVEAGRRAGCRSLLLDVGNETEWRYGPMRVPQARAADLFEAAHHIVTVEMELQRWSTSSAAVAQ